MSSKIWALILIPAAIVCMSWFNSVQIPASYLSHSIPSGQLLYIFSKLTGLLALVMIGVQIVLALLHKASNQKRFPGITLATHKRLGIATFSCVLLHVVFIIGAFWFRQDKFPAAALIPDFSNGFYKSRLSLGVIAFYLLCIGVLAGLKSRRAKFRWRIIHYSAWPVTVVLAYWHSLAIGSESRSSAVLITLWSIAAAVVFALCLRISRSARSGTASEPRVPIGQNPRAKSRASAAFDGDH